MKKILFALLVLLAGCSWINKVQIPVPKAVVLDEDKIYTIRGGTEVDNIYLDNKLIGKLIFPFDMKLVAPNVLVKQELMLNDALLSKVKADKNHSQLMQILGAVAAFCATMAGIWIKVKLTKAA